MEENSQHRTAIQRAENLLRKRKEILATPPEFAVDRILEAEHPPALVQSFSEEDFYFLIHDIGPEDSLPLLSMASKRQLEYILDIEVWEKDRIDLKSVTRWIDLLLHADPGRLAKWILDEKLEFFEFYLFKNIDVVVREHDQDPSDFGEGFETFDDVYYFRLIEHAPSPDDGPGAPEHRNENISKILEHIASLDHTKFQQFLLESASVIPAETEEEEYRWRNVRLAEKGFLPFDEAISIYQPLAPGELIRQGKKYMEKSTDPTAVHPAPLYPVGVLEENNRFSSALQVIDTEEVLLQLQSEFAGLANQIIAADQNPVNSREALAQVVKKTCGYLNIGLEILSEKGPKIDIGRSVALIRDYPLSRIFRVGYGLGLKLKWRAERWRKQCWFVEKGLPLRFWDEKWMGVLGGLFVKKPLFHDDYHTGQLYREFMSLDDIASTENLLNEIIAFDRLLSLIPFDVEPVRSYTFLTYKNLVLTLWARNYLHLTDMLDPPTFDELKLFFDDLWSGDRKRRKVRPSMKHSFLSWLSEKTGIDPDEIFQQAGNTLENLFNEIETELGGVAKKDLDPRYITLFLIKD